MDPKKARLKKALKAGGPLGVAWFTLGAPVLIEVAGRHGMDAVVIDMQHGLFDRLSLEAAITASSAPVLVRTRDDAAASIGEALDAGAEGVLVPLVESAEAAAAVVSACRYPPAGHRSGGGVRPLADFGTYSATANNAVVAGVMIETAKGLEAAAEIAASGVDMVFIGTGDLALSLGVAPGSDAHNAACARILAACKAAKTPCGVFAMSAAAAVARIGEGYALSVTTIDVAAFETRTAEDLALFREKTARAPAKRPRKKAG
ncbi:aldolase/citrate lyase family protein [Acuticoccus sp. MNP-M23]|uniref:HpcH/HpaI aldolase family protein n=1 Tax=Acuticoccus sp. MNP-M23 TaxID=3072793 RepID=UPI002815C176|nr:aldolase/citrate lyase family protein [Acuticoccus sp. MNP-M23]WMS41462.1 aldolase/citrate lyase family protein [Acuticoccus sp. MNP-M23]